MRSNSASGSDRLQTDGSGYELLQGRARYRNATSAASGPGAAASWPRPDFDANRDRDGSLSPLLSRSRSQRAARLRCWVLRAGRPITRSASGTRSRLRGGQRKRSRRSDRRRRVYLRQPQHLPRRAGTGWRPLCQRRFHALQRHDVTARYGCRARYRCRSPEIDLAGRRAALCRLLRPYPANRAYDWDPGLNSVGGIPDANWTVYKTIQPSGGMTLRRSRLR